MKTGISLIGLLLVGVMLLIGCYNEEEDNIKQSPILLPDNQPYIELTTAKKVGQKILLSLAAASEDAKHVWIDLNNNGKRDDDEKGTDTSFNIFSPSSYRLKSQTIRIYGKVSGLYLHRSWEGNQWIGQEITELKVSENHYLEALWCSTNKLKSLDVSKNVALRVLYCDDNELNTLDLSQNIKLLDLLCDGNNLNKLDVSKNTMLKTISFRSNQIKAMDISRNLDLKSLWCTGNLISDLDVMKNTKLEKLMCDNNQLSSLNVSKNVALKELSVRGNQLTDINISKNIELESFACSDNKVTSLDISKNINIEQLFCEKTKLASLDISQNTRLKKLFCSQNKELFCIKVNSSQFENIPAEWEKDDLAQYNIDCNWKTPPADQCYIELTTAKKTGEKIELLISADDKHKANVWIDLNNNGLRDSGEAIKSFSTRTKDKKSYVLDSQTIRVYGKVTSFETVSFWRKEDKKFVGQELTSLDVSNNEDLKVLSCQANKLKSLDLSSNKDLIVLYCGTNQLTSLDVVNNKKIEILSCIENRLTDLDVSRNTNLNALHCSSNYFTSLDMKDNIALKDFRCDNNQLKSLELSNNINLEYLVCNDNPLVGLDISLLSKLHSLYSNLSCIKATQEQINKANNGALHVGMRQWVSTTNKQALKSECR